MPGSCSAWGCTNRRSLQSKKQGITFHRFPTDKALRRQWEAALRRDSFSASKSSRLCSEHFRREDFDLTGQTVRLRDGTRPTVFSFPPHLQTPDEAETPESSRTTATGSPAAESPAAESPAAESPAAESPAAEKSEAEFLQNDDHSYALPESPAALKARLGKALARVERLEREIRNVKDRERRAKKTVRGLLDELRGKNLINEELKEKLDLYSDLPIDLLSRQGHEYTESQREFALTLHLNGPKAYSYLRESLHLNLPHPHTLQRWASSADASMAST